MIVRIEAFVRQCRRLFSRNEWMAYLFNLGRLKNHPVSAGLVMIQIDGLGHTQFERAMRNGKVPFLKRLLRKGGYRNYRHYSGIPSNTPSVQGMLFYGVKSCVPAFSFKDPATGQITNMFSGDGASGIEASLKEKGDALLKGGSSYGNIFTGGAEEPHFCAASIGWGTLLKAMNPLGAPLTVVLNFHIFVRAFFLMIVELFLSIIDLFRGIKSGKNFGSEIGFIPFRVAVCVLLREIIAMGAKIDIARGLPVIHLNLAGYDEQAHHRGPTSAFAHWSLHGIDSAISSVYASAKRSKIREYDVFIYSDHGQEEALYYTDEHGHSIEETVTHVFKDKIQANNWRMYFSKGGEYWRADMLRNRPRKERVSKPLTDEQKKEEENPKVMVAAMGPIGHIYPPQPLTPEEKESFALELVASAKIPFVMIKDGPGKAVAWSEKGKFILPEQADQVLEKERPFFNEVARDVVELCHHENAGDLLLFGWKKGPRSITFARETGSHAGPGPNETTAFALLPVDALRRWADKDIYTEDIRHAALRVLHRESHPTFLREDIIEARPESILRVMTYNVHKCMGRDGRISPSRIARIIARHDPDVIAIQELASKDEVHQAERIAQKLAMDFQFQISYSLKSGNYGNAILSRFPMRPIRSGALPRWKRFRFLEPRGALWVEVDVHGRKVQIFNTHLSLSSIEGYMQIQDLMGEGWIGNPECKGPVILCGDLNALPQSKICNRAQVTLKNTQLELNNRPKKTLPSFFPFQLVDHIYVGPGIQTLRIEVPNTELEKIASDHLPMIAELDLDPKN